MIMTWYPFHQTNLLVNNGVAIKIIVAISWGQIKTYRYEFVVNSSQLNLARLIQDLILFLTQIY